MAIISTIGRKSFKVKLLFFGMYSFLIIMGATMVYPFLIMVSGSTKSAVDIKYFDVVPKFLYQQNVLYKKFTEGLFNEKVPDLNSTYNIKEFSFEYVNEPETINQKAITAWTEFLEENPQPDYSYFCGFIAAPQSKTTPLNLRLFKNWLANNYSKDIGVVNDQLGTSFIGWNNVVYRSSQCVYRRDYPKASVFAQAYNKFVNENVSYSERVYQSMSGVYRWNFLLPQFGKDIEGYNKKHDADYKSYSVIPLARRISDVSNDKEKPLWEDFVRLLMTLYCIRMDETATEGYQTYLKVKYENIADLNALYKTDYKSFEDIPVMRKAEEHGVRLADWGAFIQGWIDQNTGIMYEAPINSLSIDTVETRYQDWLLKKYGSLEAVNNDLGLDVSSSSLIEMPQRSFHYKYMLENISDIRKEFATRNYRTVADYMLFHGRGIINTVIYCGLAVLVALIFNPMAAYAMSRYKLPSTYKILLFFLCTMAFPPMVTQIPNFLLLRRLGLLNTFAALILPGVANGYAIFLLKGFFDSLPRELYESAAMDGANEFVMFWNITMSLSKPILAVVGLQAFTAAYANFMMAFVICPDEKMWTMMVWLYQLQQRSGQAVVYASLIIAAVPTFLIFLFCQNIIMRGIVVPSEK